MFIGVGGKGGTGKSTLSGLLILALVRLGKKPILAIDGDPDSNLSDILGIPSPKSLVEVMDELMAKKNSLPEGIEKVGILEIEFQRAITEEKGFDLIRMGHTEGPGCYCTANHLLRQFIEKYQKNYPYIVMDNEAGMEHLSRRTTGNLDLFLITAFKEPVSLKSALHIYHTAQKLQLGIKKTYLVFNEFWGAEEKGPSSELPILFSLPFDEEIACRSKVGQGLLDLPENSIAYQKVKEVLLKLLGLHENRYLDRTT